jgi:methionyl-tRNA synthetase
VFVLAHRYAGGTVPDAGILGEDEHELDRPIAELSTGLARLFEAHELAAAYGLVWELVRAANRYVDRTAPWQLGRRSDTDPVAAERLRTTLNTALATLGAIAVTVSPFVPALADELAKALGFEISPGALERLPELRRALAGRQLAPPPLLAPRLAGRSSGPP